MSFTGKFRCAAFLILLTSSITASAFSTRTEEWKEDALLHDGRIIKVDREVSWTFQLFYGDGGSPGMFGSWPDKFRLKFIHPDTQETIKWQGEQYFNPVLLDIVDGVPFLVVRGRPNKDTEKIYGCPELPYIYLRYEKNGLWGKWVPVPVEQAPNVLQDANLSPDYPDFPRKTDPFFEKKHRDEYGRASRDLSRDEVLRKIRYRERQSGGYFQAKIPTTYDTWYRNSDSYKNERYAKDCRPPPLRPASSPIFEASKQRVNEAEQKAATISAVVESFSVRPEIVTQEDFSRSKGAWTGHGYLSNRCDGIVKRIEPLREYFDNGGWHLTGAKLVLNSGEELPFQQTNLSKFQAPSIPQLVTCANNTIYTVSRPNKDNLLLHRFAYSGDVIDAFNIALPDVNKIVPGQGWGDIWELMPEKGHFSIVLADYTYTGTANQGGTIKRKQIYGLDLPEFREPNPKTHRSASKTMLQPVVKSFRDCPSCPEMIAIPDRNYAISKYEVTQLEWEFAMGRQKGCYNKQTLGADKPALCIGFEDAQKFAFRMNEITGKSYRLPTTTEWEYACYGGAQTSYCGGNDIEKVAWYEGNGRDSKVLLHPVGQKQPNGYGLYDMSGSVWEWMGDCWKENCDLRILRGGSFLYYPLAVHDAYIYGRKTEDIDYGIRLARTLP
jgi:hypothetical protein